MLNAHLSDGVKTVRVVNRTAAGDTPIEGDSVDMQGFDAVRFVAGFAALTAGQVTSLKAQHSADNATFTDVEGSATEPLADADANKLLCTDMIRPTQRFVRPVVVRGTQNAECDFVIAELYKARVLPVAQDSTLADVTKIVDAPDGTA